VQRAQGAYLTGEGWMFVIGSQRDRSILREGVLASIPDTFDALIALVASAYSNSGVVGFFVVIVGLQCLYFVLWAKRSIWLWIRYWLSGRKKMTAHMVERFTKNGFPQPPAYVSDISDYLRRMTDNETIPCQLRVKAAIELGALAGLYAQGQHQLLRRLTIASDDALNRFAARPQN
jgi:hypothetical protein